MKSPRDGAFPSGNGVVTLNLLRLAELTGEERYLRRAEDALGAFREDLETTPGAVETLALALHRLETMDAGEPAVGSGDLVAVTVRREGEPGDDGARTVALELDILDGWHVNANPATLDELIPTEVQGGIGEFDYPEGETVRFGFVDHDLAVYQGRVELRGRVAADTRMLALVYQACDDRRCLPPVTMEVAVRP